VSEILCESDGWDWPPNLCTFLHFHCLNWDLCKCTVSGTDYQVTIWKNSHCVDTLCEVLANRRHPLVDCPVDVDLYDITCWGSTVHIFILRVNDHSMKLSLEIAQIHNQTLDLLVIRIDGQQKDPFLSDCNDSLLLCVEELEQGDRVGA